MLRNDVCVIGFLLTAMRLHNREGCEGGGEGSVRTFVSSSQSMKEDLCMAGVTSCSICNGLIVRVLQTSHFLDDLAEISSTAMLRLRYIAQDEKVGE